VALEEPEIRSTDPNIPIDNNWTNNEGQFRMPGGSTDQEHEGDESSVRNATPAARQRRWPATEFERFYLGTNDVDGYEGEDSDNADADEAKLASKAADRSMRIVED